MSEENKPSVLMCSRIEDLKTVTLGASFSHICAECGKPVVVSLSGQTRLAQDAEMRIVCVWCVTLPENEKVDFQFSAESGEKLLKELANQVPNPFKNSN